MRAQARAAIGHAADLYGLDRPDGAIPVPREPRRPSRALSPADAATLEAAAHTAGLAGTAVLIGLYTAARRSEIAGMEWSRITDQTVTFWRPKTKDWHTVPLHPALAEHLEQRRGEGWVFPGRWGGHVSPAQVWRWACQVSEDAGLGRVTPHVWRHTCLTTANDASRDLRAAQELAGHTDPAVTARYTRVGADRLARVVNLLDYQTPPPAAEEGA